MKGLLRKDIYVLTRQMRFFLLFLAIFALMPGFNMAVFAIAYTAMLPYTAMAYDERSKWSDLAAMMPYTPGDIVFSKYLLGWALVASATALSLLPRLLFGSIIPSYTGSLSALFLSFCVGLVVIAVTMPLLFRFGVEKGRVGIVMLIIVVSCGGAGLVQGIAEGGSLPANITTLTYLGIPILAVVLTTISLPLSVRLYRYRLK